MVKAQQLSSSASTFFESDMQKGIPVILTKTAKLKLEGLLIKKIYNRTKKRTTPYLNIVSKIKYLRNETNDETDSPKWSKVNVVVESHLQW